ncbi:MAG: glucokinase [Gammaproteobacteria bacterium]|nr:glucokinase [Gammaproteobacteria bacterium]NIV52004.1 glucokinase [Gammaproteobacteria bacterium]
MSVESWPGLVGDIGGTRARFGIVEASGAPVTNIQRQVCADFASLELAITSYLDAVCTAPPRSACLAVAGPVTGDRVQFSNRGWDFSIAGLQERFALAELGVINDFEALALSLPQLRRAGRKRIGRGQIVEGTPMAVVGPGTGLGVAGLVPSGTGWVPVAGEGGHVELAAADELEVEVMKVVRAERGRVSAESLLSGHGFRRLYRAIAAIEDRTPLNLEPRAITAYARGGEDPEQTRLCRLTAEVFMSLFAGFAGDVGLTFGARGGVYLAGGIIRKLDGLYSELAFRQRFEAKGRMSGYVREIPTFVVTAETPALLGAASWLSNPASASARAAALP